MTREEKIARIAYRIWEQEGRVEGYHLDHWLEAEQTWEQEGDGLAESAPATPPSQAPPKRRAAKSG